MKRQLLLFVFVSLMSSCLKPDVVTDDRNPPCYTNTTIPLSEALNSLDELVNGLNKATKSNPDRVLDIANVEPVGANLMKYTKSLTPNWSIPDTLMYLVNFDNNEGFAVLAGDTRLGERVLCLTESGMITSSDFVKAIDYFGEDSFGTKTTIDDDSFFDMGKSFVPAVLFSAMLADLFDGYDDSTTKSLPVVTYHQTLLDTKWGQFEPFFTYTPADGSTPHCPTGCTPTACAQIMAYCQKPLVPIFDGVTCDWLDMLTVCTYLDPSGSTASASAKEQVARFLYHIGKSNLCDVSYHASGSGAYASGAERTLKYYGYKKVARYLGFGSTNQSRVSSMLAGGLPAFLSGFDFHNGGGHSWVIDGEYNGYFHCNWGWYGDWDGYFAKHNWFKLDYRNSLDSKDSGTTNNLHKDFDWNFRLVTYDL